MECGVFSSILKINKSVYRIATLFLAGSQKRALGHQLNLFRNFQMFSRTRVCCHAQVINFLGNHNFLRNFQFMI